MNAMRAERLRTGGMVLALALASSTSAMAARPPPRADVEQPGSALLSGSALSRADGQQLFVHICQGCHMPDAGGAQGAGAYPALAGDPRLASSRFMAATVLFGRRNMPSFSSETRLQGFEAMTHIGLSDAQVADVVNYVRSHFGNHYADLLTAADVAAMHPPAHSP
jgi:mono/diheme cytochrome c family protein